MCNTFSSESKQQLRKVSGYGDAGRLSPNLSQAKRAIYHLGYLHFVLKYRVGSLSSR